jgi:regulator of RNase E activity RraA
LARLSIPVFARGATPKAAPAQGVPEVQVPITLSGVPVNPGDLVISDDDGIVIGSDAQIGAAIEAADRIHAAEANILAALADGVSLFERLNFEDHVARRRQGQPSALTFLT